MAATALLETGSLVALGGASMTTVRWVLLCLILAAVFAMPQNQASAGGRGACVTDFWGKCVGVARHRHAYRWRYYRHRRYGRRHHHHHRGYPGSGERIDHGLICHARRRVIGEEQSSERKARKSAEDSWMASVRYDHGERYQDIRNAKDYRLNCDFSSGIRPGLFKDILKARDFQRCVVEATPCRAGPGAAKEQVERRFEFEDDE